MNKHIGIVINNKDGTNSAVIYKKSILLANSEAHRFAIGYHRKLRSKNFTE